MKQDIVLLYIRKKSDINEYMSKLIIGHEIRNITGKVYIHHTIEELCLEMELIIRQV